MDTVPKFALSGYYKLNFDSSDPGNLGLLGVDGVILIRDPNAVVVSCFLGGRLQVINDA